MSKETILDYMIKNDLSDDKKYMVSHHIVKSPERIDVKTNEVVYIDKIILKNSSPNYWLEFHSATENRIISTKRYEQITRNKGNIYFSNFNLDSYSVSYIKLRLIRDN